MKGPEMDTDLAIRLLTLALIALTQFFDWHSTRAFLRSGKGFEANDFVRRLQARFGVTAAMAGKGVLHVLIAAPVVWLLPPLVMLAGLVPYLIIYARIIRKNYRIARGDQ